ncbi:MAG: ferrous iron transport protein A [Dehalococcoidia bacterium]|nr:ferrous iron transport protein A [Dehalococcoidia bacterium]
MNNNNIVTLNQMTSGTSGMIHEIAGGHGLRRRLEALGIRQGCQVTKISSYFLRGPVTLRTGSTQIAIGHGMASKIFVHVNGTGGQGGDTIS